jgi:hypothetical protein
MEGVLELEGVPIGDGVGVGVGVERIAILRSFPVPKSHTYITPLGVSKYNPYGSANTEPVAMASQVPHCAIPAYVVTIPLVSILRIVFV